MRNYITAGLILLVGTASAAACERGEYLTVSFPDDRVEQAIVDITRAEVPLPDAIEALLPEGWNLYNPRSLREPRVSVAPGATFDQTLMSIANQAQACIHVHGARRIVMVRPRGDTESGFDTMPEEVPPPRPVHVAETPVEVPAPPPPAPGKATTAPLTVSAPTPFDEAPPPAKEPPLAPLPSTLTEHVAEEGLFDVRAGETLRAVLTRWCEAAGYTLIWRAPIDLRVEASITYPTGTRFSDAVRMTLGAFWRGSHSVVGTLYENRVLVVDGRDS